MNMKTEFNELVDQEFKDEFKILDKNESRRDRIWKECVEEAKILTRNYKEIRFKLVDIALKCCSINRGGRTHSEKYSLDKFAKEVGINHKTLSEWVRIKTTIFDQLNEEDKKQIAYEDLAKVDRSLTGVNRRTDQYKAVLSQKFKEYKAKHPDTVRMEKYLKHLKTIEYNALHPLQIKGCKEEVIVEIISTCRNVIKLLSAYDKKEKYANK